MSKELEFDFKTAEAMAQEFNDTLQTSTSEEDLAVGAALLDGVCKGASQEEMLKIQHTALAGVCYLDDGRDVIKADRLGGFNDLLGRDDSDSAKQFIMQDNPESGFFSDLLRDSNKKLQTWKDTNDAAQRVAIKASFVVVPIKFIGDMEKHRAKRNAKKAINFVKNTLSKVVTTSAENLGQGVTSLSAHLGVGDGHLGPVVARNIAEIDSLLSDVEDASSQKGELETDSNISIGSIPPTDETGEQISDSADEPEKPFKTFNDFFSERELGRIRNEGRESDSDKAFDVFIKMLQNIEGVRDEVFSDLTESDIENLQIINQVFSQNSDSSPNADSQKRAWLGITKAYKAAEKKPKLVAQFKKGLAAIWHDNFFQAGQGGKSYEEISPDDFLSTCFDKLGVIIGSSKEKQEVRTVLLDPVSRGLVEIGVAVDIYRNGEKSKLQEMLKSLVYSNQEVDIAKISPAAILMHMTQVPNEDRVYLALAATVLISVAFPKEEFTAEFFDRLCGSSKSDSQKGVAFLFFEDVMKKLGECLKPNPSDSECQSNNKILEAMERLYNASQKHLVDKEEKGQCLEVFVRSLFEGSFGAGCSGDLEAIVSLIKLEGFTVSAEELVQIYSSNKFNLLVKIAKLEDQHYQPALLYKNGQKKRSFFDLLLVLDDKKIGRLTSAVSVSSVTDKEFFQHLLVESRYTVEGSNEVVLTNLEFESVNKPKNDDNFQAQLKIDVINSVMRGDVGLSAFANVDVLAEVFTDINKAFTDIGTPGLSPESKQEWEGFRNKFLPELKTILRQKIVAADSKLTKDSVTSNFCTALQEQTKNNLSVSYSGALHNFTPSERLLLSQYLTKNPQITKVLDFANNSQEFSLLIAGDKKAQKEAVRNEEPKIGGALVASFGISGLGLGLALAGVTLGVSLAVAVVGLLVSLYSVHRVRRYNNLTNAFSDAMQRYGMFSEPLETEDDSASALAGPGLSNGQE